MPAPTSPESPRVHRSADAISQPPVAPSLLRARWVPWLAAVTLALLLYSPSLDFDFTYDDVTIVTKDERLDQPGFVWQIPVARWWPKGSAKLESRPLTTFTIWAQVHLHGRSPRPFHALNLALFALLCVQVSMLAERLTGWRSAAWIGGLLFAAHPIHVEVVANIVGRAEVLASIFALLAIQLYLHWRGQLGWARAAAVGLCVLLAGLAKESGYLSGAMILAIELAMRRREGRPLLRDLPWAMIVCIAVVAVLAASQRWAVVTLAKEKASLALSDIDNPLIAANATQRLVTPFKLVGKATQLLTVPVDQSADYSPRVLLPTSDLLDPLVLLGIIMVTGWAAAVGWAWRKRSVMLGVLLAMAVAWAIPSNTFLLIGTIFGERLLTMLSIWAAVLVGALVAGRRTLLIAAAVAVVLFSFATIFYLPVWRDDVSLTVAVLSRYPTSGRFQGFLSRDLAMRGVDHPEARQQLFKDAEDHARLALEYWPLQGTPYEALAIIAHYRGQPELERQMLDMSRLSGVELNFAERQILSDANPKAVDELEASEKQMTQQLAANPDDRALMRRLAAVRLKLKKPDTLKLYRQLYTPDTTDRTLLSDYSEAAILAGEPDDLLKIYRRWLELEPDNWSLMTNAAIVGNVSGIDATIVRSWIDKAIALSPGSPEPWAALGNWYELRSDPDHAADSYRQALKCSPSSDPKHGHYQLMLDRLKSR